MGTAARPRAAAYEPPFPWFGGKSRAAAEVWRRFGAARNYVEPFAGSLAMLMLRPTPFVGTETANDACGMIANFWRAVKSDPQAVAAAADRPVNENDYHAIEVRLKDGRALLTARLEGDIDYFDAKLAGWWAWGQCCHIGSGWCGEGRQGPWDVVIDDEGYRQLVHLGNAGRGVKRQRVHLGNAGQGINRKLVHLGNAGRGVNRKLVHLGDAGRVSAQTAADATAALVAYFDRICDRIRHVRVCCGDWSRVCGPTPTTGQGLTAVFLDPPYGAAADRAHGLYARDSLSVARDVREWAIAHGDDPQLRIALCGYDGEHGMPASWSEWAWKANGGYGSQSKAHANPNARRERIWFNGSCLPAGETDPFAAGED